MHAHAQKQGQDLGRAHEIELAKERGETQDQEQHVASHLNQHTNKFGIGVYTDTEGSPTTDVQLNATQQLVGRGGWVTLFLCSWRNGASSSCMNASTTHDDASNKALLAAYSRGINVVARIGNPYFVRDHADDASQGTHFNYSSLAAAYARLVASLPQPPAATRDDGVVTASHLYVTVGNEFNACNEWRCSGSQ